MLWMCYEQYVFENDPDRRDTFIPKTIYCPYCDDNIPPSNLLDLKTGTHNKNLYIHKKEVHHPDRDLGIFKSDSKFELVD